MKETKKCKYCQTEIDAKAKICPHCKKKQGGKGKIIAIVVVVLVIIAIIGGSGDEDQSKPSGESTSASGETKTAQVESTTEAVDNIFHPGDILETKKVRLSYISCAEYVDNNEFVTAGDGKKYVSFEFEFENISSSDVSVGSFNFKCYADGYEASQGLVTADNTLISITSLSPGRKASGIVVFEVPENASEIEVEYETDYWKQDKVIFIYE